MYYALTIYPRLDHAASDQIAAIRSEYDPTASFIEPHITVLFPTPGRVEERALIRHLEKVLSSFQPFEIQLSGFHKSRDHWLFLTLDKGRAEVRRMYQRLYTGILAEFCRDHTKFIPHLGLGLFLKKGTNYDWSHPCDENFDEQRYKEALQKAMALPLPISVSVQRLHLTMLPDALFDWATGRRAHIPEEIAIARLREFRLGS